MVRTRLIAVLGAVALAGAAGGCGESDEQATAGSASAAKQRGVEAIRASRPVKPDHDGIPLQTPPDAYPLIWVRVHEQIKLRTAPGGELVDKVGRRTQWGSISAFGVVRQAGRWVAVTTPVLPNNELAWVRLDPERLRGGWTKMAIAVDLSDRHGVLLREGAAAMTFPVSIGMPGSETPTGRFSVTDTFRGDLNPAYGCCAIALTATQPHLPSGWLGGHRIAIHGTYSELGVAASHGCVRAANATVAELIKRVPLGAPVFIRA